MNTLTEEILLQNYEDAHWLTRQVIEAFPEKDLFTFSIGGMRPFSEMIKEFIGIWDYILKEALKEQHISLFEQDKFPATKTELLALRDQVFWEWDASSLTSICLFACIGYSATVFLEERKFLVEGG